MGYGRAGWYTLSAFLFDRPDTMDLLMARVEDVSPAPAMVLAR
jgi:hypothetical protein